MRSTIRTPPARAVTVRLAMALDRAKTARGALAGAVAAGVWAAQQPLDIQRLRRRLRRHRAARQDRHPRPARGARSASRCTSPTARVFGAIYAAVAPRLPLPSWARGPAAALAEHVATWPLDLADRLHPAGDDFPPLFANPRAFAQATWRHAALRRRPRRARAPPERPRRRRASRRTSTAASTNGHGDLEAALSGARQ